MGSVLVKLATLLTDEYKLLKDARKEIAFLERELRRMQKMVTVLADMEKLDELAKEWKDSIRDLSYDMEDCIDRFMLRLGNGDASRRFMKKTARRLRTMWVRHDLATQIKELKARVVEESARRERYNLDHYVASQTTPVEIDPRLPAFHEVVKGLVAIDGRRDQVVSWLTEDSVELKVVAIFGGAGLGKTTLAMEVYREIKWDFSCRACVSVSRTPNLDQLLKDVLCQIDEDAFSKCQLERWTTDKVIRQIQQILTEERYAYA